ncbi:carbohydrate ABC transporter permease [Dactylosporangium sp. CA-052675]|uniref:carbohydrate ABC transporter permease n=1 Tax=Dactylosporangium sp. CA-052675 TaxID=3239927 RepID=UPI003D8D4AC8
MKHVFGNKKAIATFLLPALLIYLGVMVVPAVWSLFLAFMHGNPVRGFEFTGMKNIDRLFSDPQAGHALWFTLKYAIVVTVGQIVLGYALALLYVFVLRKASTFVRTLVFFPVVVPTVAVALLFNRMFASSPQEGPVNALLGLVGLGGTDWFADGNKAFIVIVIMDLWRTMGFFAVLLYAGLIEIPEEIMESARLDGAGTWRLVRHIVLPLSMPVLLATVIFSLNASLKVFDSIVALNNGGPGYQTTPLNLLMFKTAFSFGDFGYGSTLALVITLVCLTVTLFVFRSSRRDLTKD